MANGFLISSPGSRHGAATVNGSAGKSLAQKFTIGGSGTQELSEIGSWISADAATTGVFHLGVFTHDAANDCPESLVADSDSGELSISSTTVSKVSLTYGTKPQLTGGGTYWITIQFGDNNSNLDGNGSGGTSLDRYDTYPTWPTATAWETHTDRPYDYGVYAVYAAAGGGSAHPYTGGIGDGAITQSAATQRIRGIVRELGGSQAYSAGTVKARGKAPVSGGTITFAAGADYSKATLYLYTGGASQAYGAAADYFKTSASTAYSYVGNGVLVFSNGSERIIGRVYERGGTFLFSGGAVYSRTSGATNYDYSGLSGGAIVFSNVSVYFYDPSEREEKPRLRAISHEALPTRPPGQDGFYADPAQDGFYDEYPVDGFYADIGYFKEFKPFHRATFTKEGKPS